jgi:hypothetical protein
MSSLIVVTPATANLVSLATMKRHLRVEMDAKDDDELISLYAAAAVDVAESDTGRSFVNKLYCQSHDRFPSLHDWGDFATGYFYQTRRYSRGHHDEHDRQEIKLLRCPLVNIQSIQYIDTNGDTQMLLPVPEPWAPNQQYTMGDQVVDLNGNLQQITAVDDSKAVRGKFLSGSLAPAWGASLNATATDGPFTWTCEQIPAATGDFLVNANAEPPRITPLYEQAWPLTMQVMNAVKIFFTAGYGNTGAAAPAIAKVGTMQITANWYENRESVTADTLKRIPNHLQDMFFSITVRDYAPTR